ncbi:hypothetical protein CB1_001073030 [Camelus ferus]|nr:hypothetical protein CB1_001073030 [Camelus ferus]
MVRCPEHQFIDTVAKPDHINRTTGSLASVFGGIKDDTCFAVKAAAQTGLKGPYPVDFPPLLTDAFPEGGSALLTGLQPLGGQKLTFKDLQSPAGHVSHQLRLDSTKLLSPPGIHIQDQEPVSRKPQESGGFALCLLLLLPLPNSDLTLD